MRPFLVLIVAFLGAVFSYAQPDPFASFPYVIDHFAVDITLEKSGSMHVQEVIDVTFHESRRGIFRLIPIVYDNGKGQARSVQLGNIRVTDPDGNPMTVALSVEGDSRKIRIGDAEIYLPAGTKKTYVIDYDVRGMMNWFDENADWDPSSQLYWNVTGNEWDTVMRGVSGFVKFPRIEDGRKRAKIFVGGYGSTSNILINGTGDGKDGALGLTAHFGPEILKFERKTPVNAYEGVTMVIDMPLDLIDRPTQMQVAEGIIKDNIGYGIPILAILGSLFAWLTWGKDPKGGPMVVHYDPPDGLGGPEVGTLLDERVDQRDIAAGIISLAVKGHLTIDPQEEGWVFKRKTATLRLTGDKGQPLSPFENSLLSYLRLAGNEITESELRTHVAPHLSSLQQELYDEMVLRGYYRKNPNTVRALWMIFGVIALVATGVIATILHPLNKEGPAIVGCLISLPFILVFGYHMPKRTTQGAKVRQQVIGFEDFMRRVEKDQIEWAEKTNPDAALFEKYLPHAIAMGLGAEWAKRFMGIVHETPSWYLGSNRTFGPYWFSNDLGTISSSIGSAAATPPRSSGASGGGSGFSSGGGFSGGGFGGGGGGSW